MDLGAHLVDLTRYFLGECRHCASLHAHIRHRNAPLRPVAANGKLWMLMIGLCVRWNLLMELPG